MKLPFWDETEDKAPEDRNPLEIFIHKYEPEMDNQYSDEEFRRLLEAALNWFASAKETPTEPLSSCMCRDAFGRHLPSCPVGQAIVADGMKETKGDENG